MLPRFYVSETLPGVGDYILPANVAHHAKQVLRLRVGDPLILFDGTGGQYQAQILALQPQVQVRLETHQTVTCESPLNIELVQALATGDKMDWIVQKAVELGANSFLPIMSERSVLKLDSERATKRVAHWQQIAIAASEQCGRNRVMLVQPVTTLLQALSQSFAGVSFMLDPAAEKNLPPKSPAPANIRLYIGPEGGWSDTELKAMRSAHCQGIKLGPRVLRTETAGLVALAAINARWGDF